MPLNMNVKDTSKSAFSAGHHVFQILRPTHTTTLAPMKSIHPAYLNKADQLRLKLKNLLRQSVQQIPVEKINVYLAGIAQRTNNYA